LEGAVALGCDLALAAKALDRVYARIRWGWAARLLRLARGGA
jgi:hypothetical protein